MLETQPRPRTGAPASILLPLTALSVMSGLAFAGRRKKPETMPRRAARKLGELGLQPALDTAQTALDELRVQVANQDVDALRQQVSDRAGTLVDSAKTAIPPATQSASELARELAAEIAERFKTDIAPAAKDWAEEAVSEAEDILSAARQKASALTESAVPVVKETAPELGARASAAAGLVAGTAATAAQSLGRRAAAGTSSSSSGVHSVASGVGDALGAAGQQTKYALTETLLICFWLSALGAVVYYAILSPSQQEKVRNFLNGAAQQLQGVMAEFQGTGDEFPSGTAAR